MEKEDQEKRFERLKAVSESGKKLSMDMFSENWNASQFWVQRSYRVHCYCLKVSVQ